MSLGASIDKSMDTLICQGFEYDCQLGFHEHERDVTQKISVDIEVAFPVGAGFTPALGYKDNPSSVPFDYFKANELIAAFLKDKQFNLIETVCQAIAEMLLESFALKIIKVSVTKFPLNMANVKAVTYCCSRESDDTK